MCGKDQRYSALWGGDDFVFVVVGYKIDLVEGNTDNFWGLS